LARAELKSAHACARTSSPRLQGNLGHLESAAGLASLVKVLVMARHRVLLPTASFEGWSPKIDAARLNIRVVAEVERLATPAGAPFFMGINSFGERCERARASRTTHAHAT
jgi:acyl transferase domain-containing protein